jgi:hypothetical protein
VQPLLEVNVPVPQLEVEIVVPVLRPRNQWDRADRKGAQNDTGPNGSDYERGPGAVIGACHDCTRVNVVTQLATQLRPPSAENACSKWNDVGVMSEKMKRTKIARPWKSSWS